MEYIIPLYFKLIKIMKDMILFTHIILHLSCLQQLQIYTAIEKQFLQSNTTSNRKRNWKWYAPIESWMYGQYNHIICISKVAEEKLRLYMRGDGQIIKKINTNAFPQLIMVQTWKNLNASPDKELITLKENRKAILMVAGFRDAKDQDTIVKALSSLDKNKFEIWFAGIGIRMEKFSSQQLRQAQIRGFDFSV